PPPRRARRHGIRRLIPTWRGTLLTVLGVGLVVALAGLGAFLYLYQHITIPDPNSSAIAQTTIVTYNDGHTELGRFGGTNRVVVPLSDVPVPVREAVLAAEDRTFYTNPGFSLKGIVRAAINDAQGRPLQGGSTITEQYVKNNYLTDRQTITRKIKEFVIALKVARELPKDKILADYLNTVYYGRGAYGIQTAAQSYFGVNATQLTVAEGAVLASLINAPSALAPESALPALTARWAYVLDGMVTQGWLTPAQRAALRFPTIRPVRISSQYGGTNGYLLSTVRAELLNLGFTNQQIDQGGLKVVSTFSQQAQQAAVAAVEQNRPTISASGVHEGLAAVVPGTGAVLAMYGGSNYVTRPFNDATQGAPQAGSTMKAFTLSAAFEQGIGLNSYFDGNSPLQLPGSPPVHNEFNTNYGKVSLLTATEQSINTAFVQLTMKIGPQNVYDAAIRAGIPKSAPGLLPNARITLGTAAVTPVQLADGYATVAAQGIYAPWHTVDEVFAANGGVLYRAPANATRAFSPQVTANVTYLLSNVVQHGTGTAALALGRPAAGKTGTAGNRSAWFVGFTPQLATAVGFYRGSGTASLSGVGGLPTFFGADYPARTWTAFMQGALAGQPVLGFPAPVSMGTPVDLAPTPTPSPSPSSSASSSTTPTVTGSPTPSSSGTTVPSPGSSPTSSSGAPTPGASGGAPLPTGPTVGPLPPVAGPSG
ncbi:MAG: transglycosylase domain-containing protein, partial [Actinomycetes bacterium]